MTLVEGLVGAGVQGPSSFSELDQAFDAYLILDSDLGACEGLGARAWLRIMQNGGNWRDPIAWAKYCVEQFKRVYAWGTRVMIPLNEANLELEGGGDKEADYIFLGGWWKKFLPEVRRLLIEAGMGDVFIGGPCLSPGHQESDGGRYFKYLVYCLKNIDIFCGHYYWYQGGGFLGDPNAIYFAQRLETDLAYFEELGIPEKPIAITEYNRPVDINDENDRRDYVNQVKRFNDWKPKVSKFVFLATNTDESYNRLSLAHMPGSIDELAEWKKNRKPPEVDPMTQKTTKIGNLEVIDLRGELPDHFPAVPFQDKDFISIHHSVSGETTAKVIYDLHIKEGFGGIGYNFLVHMDGKIEYVGECNTERAAVGQITKGNYRGIHICMLGDFTKDHPTTPQKASTKRLIAEIQQAYGWFIPVVPHRIFNGDSKWNTACPGDSYREWWHELLRAVGD